MCAVQCGGRIPPIACMPAGMHVRQQVAALRIVFFIRVLRYLSVYSIALYRMDNVHGDCGLLEVQRTPQAQVMHTLDWVA